MLDGSHLMLLEWRMQFWFSLPSLDAMRQRLPFASLYSRPFSLLLNFLIFIIKKTFNTHVPTRTRPSLSLSSNSRQDYVEKVSISRQDQVTVVHIYTNEVGSVQVESY